MILSSPGPLNSNNLNFGAIAGLYSQLAAVLAGFAFASLIALVAAQLTARSRATMVLQSFAPLISSFIGLIATSLNYAIIAGEGQHTNRGATLETIGGLGFCAAGLMLFYSILMLLHGVGADLASHRHGRTLRTAIISRTASVTRWTINTGLGPLVIFLLYGGAVDQEAFRYGVGSGFHRLDYLGLGLTVFSCIMGASFLVFVRPADKLDAPGALPAILAVATISISLISVAGTAGCLMFMNETTSSPESLAIAEFLMLTILVGGVGYSSAKFRIPKPDDLTGVTTSEQPARIFNVPTGTYPTSYAAHSSANRWITMAIIVIGLSGILRRSRPRRS